MSFSDPIGDMIARIRNGQMRSHNKIEMPASTFKGQILDVLKKEGYIINYSFYLFLYKSTRSNFYFSQLLLVIVVLQLNYKKI